METVTVTEAARHLWNARAIAQASVELDLMNPECIVAWAIERFPGRLALSCSFGGDGGTMLAHLTARHNPPVPILFLDTGLLFRETYEFKQHLTARLDLHVIDVLPSRTVDEQAEALGPSLWERDPNRCCLERKVKPMQHALRPFDAWMTGIQRGQTADRKRAPVFEFDSQYDVLKINPLVNTSSTAIEEYLQIHSLPQNPLKAHGYLSIGCWPCTTPVVANEDPRAGRWRGTGKTECGLHTGLNNPKEENTA